MKISSLLLMFLFVSCGSAQYVLHSRTEAAFMGNENTPIVSSNGVTLTYDRAPFVRVEGKGEDGSVRLFYKLIISNLSDKPVEVQRDKVFLEDIKNNSKYRAKFNRADAKLLERKISKGEKLELDVIFDVEEKTIEDHKSKSQPLYISTHFKNEIKLDMKVWLWELKVL